MVAREIQIQLQQLQPWFHCIDLGDGLRTKTSSAIGEPVDHPQPTWQAIQKYLPSDLDGKSVLDVGCNAGFYSIEMKRRGAARVVGVDSQGNLIRQAQFVRKLLGLDIEYRRLSVYDLDPIAMGQFDVSLALGLIYHCKHLVLALEKLFAITRDLLVIETAVYPPERAPASFEYEEGGSRPTLHPMAYVDDAVEGKEAIYNWFLPSVEGFTALLRNVGFDHIEVFPSVQSDRYVFLCRKRQPFPDSRMIAYLGGRLTFLSGPSQTQPTEIVTFRIRAENTGYARWLRGDNTGTEKGSVHMVTHVLRAVSPSREKSRRDPESPEIVFWYHAGAFLPRDIAPGETVDLEIAVRAPEEPGEYILAFDLVSEHLAWFEDLGSSIIKHPFKIV
jgi:tRNA (mo5U34)-methyltransferase